MTAKKVTKKKSVAKKVEPAVKNITEAFFNFQSEDISIQRNGVGTSNGQEYRYAELEDIMKAIRPVLQKYRIALTQIVEENNLLTKLIHVDSLTEMTSPLPLGTPQSSQDLGARITYMRRYALVAMLGLVTEDDVDGTNKSFKTQSTEKRELNGVILSPQKEIASMPSEKSALFNKALGAIESASNQNAISLISGQLKKSTRLTDNEKVELQAMLDKKTIN